MANAPNEDGSDDRRGDPSDQSYRHRGQVEESAVGQKQNPLIRQNVAEAECETLDYSDGHHAPQ